MEFHSGSPISVQGLSLLAKMRPDIVRSIQGTVSTLKGEIDLQVMGKSLSNRI